jgi:RNA recognition motif-containing protein
MWDLVVGLSNFILIITIMRGSKLISMFSMKHELHPSSHSQWRFFTSSSQSSSSASSYKLFVGGLYWSVDEKFVKDAFSSFGDVN